MFCCKNTSLRGYEKVAPFQEKKVERIDYPVALPSWNNKCALVSELRWDMKKVVTVLRFEKCNGISTEN